MHCHPSTQDGSVASEPLPLDGPGQRPTSWPIGERLCSGTLPESSYSEVSQVCTVTAEALAQLVVTHFVNARMVPPKLGWRADSVAATAAGA